MKDKKRESSLILTLPISAVIFSALLVLAAVAISTTAIITPALAKSPKLTDGQRYRSGYDHGCSDAKNGNHYLAGSGGTAAHTHAFITGYNDGFRNCQKHTTTK